MISISAPAKINLYLHITGKRDDGYHLLDSLAAFAGVYDTISVRPAATLSLMIDGLFSAGLPVDESNLVMRAAHRLRDLTGVQDGADISLTKRLPVASGIGGGSADAAATIKALARLWSIHPGQHDLSGLALDLGADVPICLFGQAAFMSGIGEKLEPLGGLPNVPMILVNPGVDISTPTIFNKRRGAFSLERPFTDIPVTPEHLIALLNDGRGNDLMEPAIELAPVIGQTLEAIKHSKGCRFARMSGSGATCFGFFDSQFEAKNAAAAITRDHPDWWAMATELVSDASSLTD